MDRFSQSMSGRLQSPDIISRFYFDWVLIMDFRFFFSMRSNLLHSDLHLRDGMRSKAKVNPERKHEETIKYVHSISHSELSLFAVFCLSREVTA